MYYINAPQATGSTSKIIWKNTEGTRERGGRNNRPEKVRSKKIERAMEIVSTMNKDVSRADGSGLLILTAPLEPSPATTTTTAAPVDLDIMSAPNQE